jgi:hypothetical protein
MAGPTPIASPCVIKTQVDAVPPTPPTNFLFLGERYVFM